MAIQDDEDMRPGLAQGLLGHQQVAMGLGGALRSAVPGRQTIPVSAAVRDRRPDASLRKIAEMAYQDTPLWQRPLIGVGAAFEDMIRNTKNVARGIAHGNLTETDNDADGSRAIQDTVMDLHPMLYAPYAMTNTLVDGAIAGGLEAIPAAVSAGGKLAQAGLKAAVKAIPHATEGPKTVLEAGVRGAASAPFEQAPHPRTQGPGATILKETAKAVYNQLGGAPGVVKYVLSPATDITKAAIEEALRRQLENQRFPYPRSM